MLIVDESWLYDSKQPSSNRSIEFLYITTGIPSKPTYAEYQRGARGEVGGVDS
jgi:hypothetical protein